MAPSTNFSSRRRPYSSLILSEILRFDGSKYKMQDIEHQDIVSVEVGFVGAGCKGEDELKVSELAKLND